MEINNLPKPGVQLGLLDKARQQANENPNFWKPTEPNEGIEGTVVKIAHGGKFNSTFIHIETDDGVRIVAASPSTVLGGKLAELNIEVGDKLAILYLGEETAKAGHKFKNWSVVSEKPEQPKSAIGIFGSKE